MASVDIQVQPGHTFAAPEVTTSVAPKSLKHHVHTTLNYHLDPSDGSNPPPTYTDRPETYDRPTLAFNVTVHDIRGEEDQYTLDKQGFALYTHTSQEKDFLDDEKIKKEYYAETEQLLKEATGASRVFIFDHTIRRPQPAGASSHRQMLRGPVARVHVDQSYDAARSRVPHHLPEEAEKLLQTRHQIINVWRPIKPIFKDPLAVSDAHSVPESDLVPIQLIYPDRQGETLTVRPSKAHRWYYAYGQRPDEVTLIKCYDSKLDGRARRVPHTAFVNPATVDEAPRESIEVRALVFHEDQAAE